TLVRAGTRAAADAVRVRDERHAVRDARATVFCVRPHIGLAPRVVVVGAMGISTRALRLTQRRDARGSRVLRTARSSASSAVQRVARRIDTEALAARLAGWAKLSCIDVTAGDALSCGTAPIGIDAIRECPALDALVTARIAMRSARADPTVLFVF